MDGLLKFLAGLACVCVIGVTGHYGYAQYSAYRTESTRREELAAKANAQIEAARKRAQERLAAAEAELKDYCQVRVPSQSTDGLKKLYEQCLADYRDIVSSSN